MQSRITYPCSKPSVYPTQSTADILAYQWHEIFMVFCASNRGVRPKSTLKMSAADIVNLCLKYKLGYFWSYVIDITRTKSLISSLYV